MTGLAELPWKRAGAYGVVAWLVGAIITTLVLLLSTGGAVGGVTFLQQAIAFFLATHLWPLLLGGAIAGTGTAVLYTPATAMVCFVTGFKLVPTVGAETPGEGFRIGASIAAGYAGMTLLAIVALVGVTSITVSQIPLLGIVFVATGLAFPVALGGFGGWFAVRLLT